MTKNRTVLGYKTVAILCFLAVAFGSIIFIGNYVVNAKKAYSQALAAQATQAGKDAAAISSLYTYVQFAKTEKPVAVLPFQYKQPYGVMVLVNKQTTLQETYLPRTLETVSIPAILGSQTLQVRPETNLALKAMYAAAKKDGISIMVRSAYRSYAEQAVLWRTNGGDSFTAVPGQSEHQTGLAVDINSTPVNCGNACSLDTPTAMWLAKNAPNYGFILRYPEGKSTITGYSPERWHFRYVGVKTAQALTKAGITLDEAHALLRKVQQ